MSRKKGILVGVVAAALAVATPVFADDLDLGQPEAPPSTLAWSGDLFARYETVRSYKFGDNLSRWWLRLRYGPTWQPNDHWTFGLAAKLHESEAGNDETVEYNDNELARALTLDKWFMSYSPAEGDHLELGRDELPLSLSRMLWDPDLRPAGVSYVWQTKFGDADRLRLIAGGFHTLFMDGDLARVGPEQDRSRFSAVQIDLRLHEQDTLEPEFLLSYLHFTDLGALLQGGEDRGNPVDEDCYYYGCAPGTAAPAFLDQFEIADLQFLLHINTDVPARVLLDLDKNLGALAGDDDHSERMEIAMGDSFQGGGNEVGYAKERLAASGQLGAFNDDDWWFHAGSRGDMLWYGYGISDALRFRAGYFWERPDGSVWHWKRAMADLQWRI